MFMPKRFIHPDNGPHGSTYSPDHHRGFDLRITRRSLIKLGAAAFLTSFSPMAWAATKTEPIGVGFLLPTDGPAAWKAKSILKGFEHFLKTKTPAVKIDVITREIGPQDDKVLEALADLLSKDVRFVVAPPLYKASETVIHASAVGRAILFLTHPSVKLVSGELCLTSSFSVVPNTFQSARPLAPWTVENAGTKLFITGSQNETANEQADFFAHAYERAGGAFVDRVQTDRAGIPSVVKAIVASETQVVFAAFDEAEAGAFIEEFKAVNTGGKIALVGPNSLVADVRNFAPTGENFPEIRTLTTLKNGAEFSAGLKQRFPKDTPQLMSALDGYELGITIAAVTGKLQPGAFETDKVVEQLQTLSVNGPRGKIHFDKNHARLFDSYVQMTRKSGSGLSQKIIADLGETATPDFGCGRIGFPRRPDTDVKDEEPFWDE